ncbi:MAG: ferrous iron transport protein B [Myxococcota bacterium]
MDARRGQGLDALSTALGKALEGQASQAQVVLAPSDASKIQQATDALQLSRGQVLWLLTSSPRLLARYPQHLELLSKLRQELAEPLADTPLADTPQTDTPLPFARRLIVARYAAVDAVARACVVPTQAPSGPSVTDRADRVLTHPVYGMALFMLFMVVLFQAIFAWSEPLIGAVEAAMGALAGGITGLLPEGVLQELVVDGLIAGVGNILVFLPQIILLFLAVAVMEESGYMARVATLLDRVMRRVGLSGKAFVPLLSSFACAVPGIMAARTISNTRDRLITILVAPLMSCSARLPVYTLVIATVFAGAQPVLGFMSLGGLMVTAMYFLGLFAAIGMAWLFRRTLLKGPTPPLLVELPTYKRPAARTVLLATARRAGVFVTQTGTVILALSVILWALMAYPRTSDDPQLRLQNSIAGTMGQAIEPLIEPLGFDWKIGIGLIGSFAAREVLVSTLGQVYGVGSDVDEESVVLREALTADIDPQTGKPRFTPLVGVSLMVFFVLAMQCLSTVATVRRETASWRWPIFMIVYMNALAWMASFATFQIGRALGLG